MSDDRTIAVTPLACAVVLTAQMATTMFTSFTAEDRDGSGHRRFRGEVVGDTLRDQCRTSGGRVGAVGADRLGRRTALLSSLVLFVIACIALALVQSAAVLLIGRIVQGIEQEVRPSSCE